MNEQTCVRGECVKRAKENLEKWRGAGIEWKAVRMRGRGEKRKEKEKRSQRVGGTAHNYVRVY